MKAQFNANEFSDLFDMVAQALVRIEELIGEYKAKLQEISDRPASGFWERVFGKDDWHPETISLQIDITVRQDRKDIIERLMRSLQFAIAQDAERVILSDEEIRLLTLYGKSN